MLLICKHCHKEFEFPSKVDFCSVSCSHKYQEGKTKPKKATAPKKRKPAKKYNCKCQFCGKEYQSTTRTSRFCSRDCQKANTKRAESRKRRTKFYAQHKEDLKTVSSAYALAKRVAELFQIPKVCCECGSTETLELHHRDTNVFNNSIDNLEYRCKKCHDKAHKSLQDVNIPQVLAESSLLPYEEKKEYFLSKILENRGIANEHTRICEASETDV